MKRQISSILKESCTQLKFGKSIFAPVEKWKKVLFLNCCKILENILFSCKFATMSLNTAAKKGYKKFYLKRLKNKLLITILLGAYFFLA